jgi:hypothetical protein
MRHRLQAHLPEAVKGPGVPYYYYKRYHIIIMRVIGIRD